MKRLILSAIFIVVAFTSNAQQIDNVKLQNDFFKDINIYRKSKGLSTVNLDTTCIRIAKEQAEYCAKNDILTHTQPGRVIGNFLENGHKTYSIIDSQRCLQNWIKSPDHNYNLLAKYATKIGIYSAVSKSGATYTFLVLRV